MMKAQPEIATRQAVSTARAATEGLAILTPLAVIVGWAVTLLPVEVPTAVQSAIVALVVSLGSIVFSLIRDRVAFKASAVSLVVLVSIATAGCVTWDGVSFGRLAATQAALLPATPDIEPIQATECDALNSGALALADEAGESKSIRAPLFAGQKLATVGGSFARLAAICRALVTHESAAGVAPELRTRNRAAWATAWRKGGSLFAAGGGF